MQCLNLMFLPCKICCDDINSQESFLIFSASSPSPYSWHSDDFKMMERVDFILAADGVLPPIECIIEYDYNQPFFVTAVYDEALTEAFFWCLIKCILKIRNPAAVSIIIVLEKRFGTFLLYVLIICGIDTILFV